MESPILFHIPITGKVDRENHVIKGVSLITGDLEAEGHSLHVDDTTTDQILKCAKASGKITVKADHKGADGKTFTSIVGYVTNFSKEGKKVRGDLHLLESEALTPKIEEMAEVMPQNFGLSVAFKGPQKGEKIGTKNFARCEKLQSVDLVENPAANPDGMFSAKAVDTGRNSTMQNNNATQTGGQSGPVTLESLAALITQQNTAIAALTEQVAAQEQFLNGSNQPDLADLANLTDAEITAAGFDVDRVRAAVDEAIASGELTVEGGAPGESGAGGEGAGQAGEAAPAGSMAAALSALQKEVTALSAARNRDIRLSAKNEEEHAFSVLENKLEEVVAFATKTTEQNQTLVSENEALRTAIKTGHSFAGAATDDGVNLFAAGEKGGTFEKIVTQKFNEFSKGGTVIESTARAQAIKFAVKNHPTAYSEYRSRGGAINLQAK